MIVKIDHPRVSEWGEASAGIVFKGVSEELLKKLLRDSAGESLNVSY